MLAIFINWVFKYLKWCNKWFGCGDYGCPVPLGGMKQPSNPNVCKWLLVPFNKISGDIIPDSKVLNIKRKCFTLKNCLMSQKVVMMMTKINVLRCM